MTRKDDKGRRKDRRGVSGLQQGYKDGEASEIEGEGEFGVRSRLRNPLHPSISEPVTVLPRLVPCCTHRRRIEGCSGADLGRVLGRGEREGGRSGVSRIRR